MFLIVYQGVVVGEEKEDNEVLDLWSEGGMLGEDYADGIWRDIEGYAQFET